MGDWRVLLEVEVVTMVKVEHNSVGASLWTHRYRRPSMAMSRRGASGRRLWQRKASAVDKSRACTKLVWMLASGAS